MAISIKRRKLQFQNELPSMLKMTRIEGIKRLSSITIFNLASLER